MDKFRLFGKWFWIGIAMGFLNSLAGLIYGVAFALEPSHRKEGGIIIAWTVFVAVIVTIILQFIYPGSPLL